MSDETKSPRSDSPASDNNQPGAEPARSFAPENGESAPNQRSGKSEGKSGAAHGRHNRVSKDTGALLSRITGILRRAADEAPGDPVFPPANAQALQGTGPLRITVTGGPNEGESADETASENKTEPIMGAPAGNGNGAAPLTEGEGDEITAPPDLPRAKTGRLSAPFTGVLRHNTDGLSDLRAEIEAEGQQAHSGTGNGNGPSASTGQDNSPDSPEDLHLLDALLGQQETGASEGSQVVQPEVADLMKQMWEEPSQPESPYEEDDALLEGRFALLGGDSDAPVFPPAVEAASEPVQPAVPHFDDAVMFPDENTVSPFVEPVVEVPVESPPAPAVTIGADEFVPPPVLPAAEAPQVTVAEVQPEPAPRGKGGKRSDTIYEDLRQTLEEEESAKRKRGTGGLLRRITGSLRRTTDNLRRGKTGPVAQPELAQPSPEETALPVLENAAGEQALEPDFSDLELNDFAADAPLTPTLSSEALAGLSEDALIAGLEPSGQASAVEPEEEDWMAAIRQEGVEEAAPAAEQPLAAAEEAETVTMEPEPEEERPRRVTGGLAKIVTGILGGRAARKKTTKELDIPDELVTGRLQRSMVTGPLKGDKTRELTPEALQALEAEQQAAADRLEAESAPPDEEIQEPQNRGITGQLRSFITGILHSSEPPGTTGPLQTGDLSQNPAADRVDQSLPGRQRSMPRRTSERRETFDAQSLRHDTIGTPLPTQAAPEVSEEELLRGLGATEAGAADAVEYSDAELTGDLSQDRFGVLFSGDALTEAYSPSGETGSLDEPVDETPSQEEEIGEINLEDIWGTGIQQPAADTRQPEEAVWYVPAEEGEDEEYGKTGSLFEDQLGQDDLVSAFLTGKTGELQTPPPADSGMSAPDLRAIALEDYGEPLVEAAATGAPEADLEASELEFDEAPPARRSLWARIASLTVMQKILLVEVLLLVVLVPFLFFTALRTPEPETPSVVFPMPHSLPADVPYPTGLTLTGGWHFDLQKSTFVEGKWTPAGSEWLEGTEVRRVVALPWNKQTEAVVQTFQPGDLITLTLSNQDAVEYKITNIERRSSTEADFLADRKLSLVILLYDEESEDRWVITGER